MDRPAVVFSNLGIRSYLVWDNDRDGTDPSQRETGAF